MGRGGEEAGELGPCALLLGGSGPPPGSSALLLGGSDPPPSSRDGLRSAGGVPSNVRPLLFWVPEHTVTVRKLSPNWTRTLAHAKLPCM